MAQHASPLSATLLAGWAVFAVEMTECVAVVGAGAVGLSTAWELANRGVDVTCYDRSEPGSGATGNAAGLCYDAYVEHTDAALATRSLERFREWGVLTACPYVWVAREDARSEATASSNKANGTAVSSEATASSNHAAAAVREHAKRMAERGREVSLSTPGELADRFPALETEHLAVGAVAENAGYVDASVFVDELTERARAAGVTLRTDCPVEVTAEPAVETDSGVDRPDAVVVAAGVHTRPLLAEAGVNLALGTYRAQALETEAIEGEPPIFYDASEQFYLRPAGDGLLAGNGAHAYDGDPDEFDPSADPAFLDETRDRIASALGEQPDVARSWAGLCTATPDRDPLVGACAPGLYVAAGWHGHGFMRAPAIGDRLAKEVCGGEGIDHFDPTRFDGDEPIDLPGGIVD